MSHIRDLEAAIKYAPAIIPKPSAISENKEDNENNVQYFFRYNDKTGDVEYRLPGSNKWIS